MANPAILTVGVSSSIEAGTSTPILKALSGTLSTLNGNVWTPQNLVGCAIDGADGAVRTTASTFAWDKGCTSVETITSGEGAFWFVANTPPSFPGYPDFGGRQFFAGLTSKTNVATYGNIDFGINVWQGGVDIYEGATQKRRARAARNNGVYQVGIENGQIVYRVDGEVVYRSGQPFTYPLRVGVAFFHGEGFDHIKGNPLSTYSYDAFDAAGNPAGSFTTALGVTSWNAPATKGKYKIRVKTTNDVIGYANVDVLKRFPWGVASGLPCPTKWFQLPPEWATKETVFDDNGGEYNTPYDQPLRRWRIEYTTKLNPTQAAVLDNFWYEHKGWSEPFYFFDERDGVLYDNVRFAKDRYTRDHSKIWLQTRSIELIRRPL